MRAGFKIHFVLAIVVNLLLGYRLVRFSIYNYLPPPPGVLFPELMGLAQREDIDDGDSITNR